MEYTDVTILVDSFDGYSDIWPAFFQTFRKNWPDCPYPVYLVSNQKTYPGVQMLTTGEETSWGVRTLSAVRQLKSKYVILLLEDYLIGKPVDNAIIQETVSFLEKNNGNYLRFTNVPKSRFNKDRSPIFSLYADEEYAINLQAAIWNREYLIQALEQYPGSAWEFEIGFLKQAAVSQHIPQCGCYAMEKDPLCIINGVLKGKWFPGSVRFLKKQGIPVEWKTRGKLSFVQRAKYTLSSGLRNRLPYKIRKRLKKLLKKLGVRFVSDV